MQGIQDNMFVFETLLLSDDKSLQTLLRAVDDELIILALKEAMMNSDQNCLVVCPKELRPIFKMKWKH